MPTAPQGELVGLADRPFVRALKKQGDPAGGGWVLALPRQPGTGSGVV